MIRPPIQKRLRPRSRGRRTRLAILAYIPHAKDPADLKQFSLQISGGRAQIGNAKDILEKRDQGAEQFSWLPPVVNKDMAAVKPDTLETIRNAIGDALLSAITPGASDQTREAVKRSGTAFTEHAANAFAADYGPEVGGLIDTILHGGNVATNAERERAVMEGDSADHPVASIAGELTGAGHQSRTHRRQGRAGRPQADQRRRSRCWRRRLWFWCRRSG
jgi:hypothetical protein